VIESSYPDDSISDDAFVIELHERYAEPTVFELDPHTMLLDVKWLLRKNQRLATALKSCLDAGYLPKQEHDETENTK
jgi:hypothetical protein